MRIRPRFLIAVALAGAVLAAGTAMASQKIATDTGAKCTTCHDKPGSKLLTDNGKYYEAMHTLAGYDSLSTSFGHCTNCHVRRPGSTKLTRKGQEFAGMVKDMSALRQWLQEKHPMPAAK